MKRRIQDLSDAELEALISRKKESVSPARPQRNQDSRKVSALESFGRGALDSASLGFGPKIIGAIGAPIIGKARPDLFGEKGYKELYRELRDTARGQQQEAAEQNPYTSLAANFLGAGGLPWGAGTSIKNAAKLGGLYGTGQAIGSNDEGEVGSFDANDFINALAGGGTGALFGGATQGALNKFLPKRTPPSADALERLNLSQELDVPLTKGQVTQNPGELLQEEAALKGRLGNKNYENVKQFQDISNQKFEEAVKSKRSTLGGGQEFISKGAAAREAVEQIQEDALKARKEYSKLYQEAKQNVAKVSTSDLKEFPKLVTEDLEKAALTVDNAPKAFNELKSLNSILGEETVDLNRLEAWKQGLNRSIREVARGGQEEYALKQLSQKFDGYLDGIIEKALTEGDVEALSKLKQARKLAASWHDKYKAKDSSEFGKKFIEEIVENALYSREPFSDEMLVNKIFGMSALGFKPESANVIRELQKNLSSQDFNKIKLEAANKILSPLLRGQTPNVTTYRNNLKKFLEDNKSVSSALFSKDEMKDLVKLSKVGDAAFTRPRSLINPSGTAEVILDYLGKKSGLRSIISNLSNKRIPLEQDKIRKSVEAGEKAPRNLSAAQKAALLGTQDSVIRNLAGTSKLDSLSDEQLDTLISRKNGNDTEVVEEQIQEPQTSEPSEDIVDKIAFIESGNNPNARSKTSSASGILQFTDGTWRDGVKKYGRETGIRLQDKNNPEAQKVMTALMLRDNAVDLQQFLGREPNSTELYLTHFLGLDGAKKLMKGITKRAIAAKLLPDAAKANKAIFFNKGRPRTAAEVYQLIQRKI